MNEPSSSQEPELPNVEPASEKSAVTLPTSVLALGFIAIALVGVLIATAIKSRPADHGAASGDDVAVREAKAQLQMLQSSVDQERAKLGMSPRYGDTTQSAQAVADRISEDAATLVAMAKEVQNLIAQKDAELARRTQEWTDAVKLQGVLRDQLAKSEERLSRAFARRLRCPLPPRATWKRQTSASSALATKSAASAKVRPICRSACGK